MLLFDIVDVLLYCVVFLIIMMDSLWLVVWYVVSSVFVFELMIIMLNVYCCVCVLFILVLLDEEIGVFVVEYYCVEVLVEVVYVVCVVCVGCMQVEEVVYQWIVVIDVVVVCIVQQCVCGLCVVFGDLCGLVVEMYVVFD